MHFPANWKWVRYGRYVSIVRGGSPRPIKKYITESSDGINWIKIGDTDKGQKYITHVREKITKDGLSKTRLVHKGDFLLTNSMSFGQPYILAVDGAIHDGWLSITDYQSVFNRDFMYYLLSSPVIFNQFGQLASGSTVNNLNSDKVAGIMVPVPPLAEQERIVDMIEMLETQINDYTRQYEKIQLLDKELMPKLKESILHEIVSGNINRDATDEPFDSQINTPFEVPANWHWTTLSEIAEISLGKTPDSKNTRYWGGEFPWISISDMQNGRVLENTQKQITQAAIDEKMGAISPKGTLILSFKLSIGKVAILPTDMYHNEAIASIFITDSTVLKEWLYVILPEMVKYADVAGAVKGNTLNKKKLSNLLVPLPDIETQQKLVQIWLSALEYM
ncbi:restriction endonuclease subunit S [Weissella confusa]|uniref:Restriction endonuclease subunit S n=1 Tax=Weissella confusa TaxID=1583 RepID=A0A923NGX2_WEICO|nr:restriction endonuclease subunit S [Weissella confusa]MBC6499848.1 restriction endonuclease subunit S [Weissella confusa]MBJ7637691.1 restriction endonuclease subunit S [Weissella confusa]MCT8396578.1 restriction endonuclease subunit S [Weissella confusa]TGE48854.1 restriction endonuclease subunit S [Weissella confusa]